MNCQHEEEPGLICNDGGSKRCIKCEKAYHICNGKIKTGSPGPSLCNLCNSKIKTGSPGPSPSLCNLRKQVKKTSKLVQIPYSNIHFEYVFLFLLAFVGLFLFSK